MMGVQRPDQIRQLTIPLSLHEFGEYLIDSEPYRLTTTDMKPSRHITCIH
jgi:hypothetical protein